MRRVSQHYVLSPATPLLAVRSVDSDVSVRFPVGWRNGTRIDCRTGVLLQRGYVFSLPFIKAEKEKVYNSV